MEVAEKITLEIAIFWALWQFLSIRHAAINGKTIFPAMIPSFIFFLISFAVVLAFHLSPFHFVWLSIACIFLGFFAIFFSPVQILSIGFLALLVRTGPNEENEKEETNLDPFSFSQKSKQKHAEEKTLGFGS